LRDKRQERRLGRGPGGEQFAMVEKALILAVAIGTMDNPGQ
jgi:hypothetical protein